MVEADNMSDRWRLLQEVLRSALIAGWREARRFLLREDYSSDPPEFYPLEGSKHLGDPQQLVDARVLDVIDNALRDRIPLIRVVGEESPRSVQGREYTIAVVDPV